MKNEISIVVGSWGSYNECNSRALGSKWLKLSDYSNWKDIEKELIKQGFELDSIDEELFIQDVEGLPSTSCNWDYTHPKQLFELLKASGVLYNKDKYETMFAYLEVRSFTEFAELVDQRDCNWNDEINIYQGFSWADYGRMVFDNYGYKISEVLENFIDFAAYGRYMGDCYAEEYDDGIIEIIDR